MHDTMRLSANDRLLKYYQKSGNIDTALFFANQQLVISKNVEDKTWYDYAYFNLGYTHFMADNYKEAIKNYEIALPLLKKRKRNKERWIADCTSNMALAHLRLGNYEESYNYYAISKDNYNEVKDTNMVARIYNQLAMVRDYQGRWIEALDVYFKALRTFELINNEYGVSVEYINIATIYEQLEDYDKAKSFFEKALVLKKEIGDEYGEAIVLSSIAGFHSKDGEYEQAFEKFEKAYEIYQKFDDKYKTALVIASIGGVYSNKREYQKAIEHYSRSVSMLRPLEVYPDLSQTLSSLGENYSKVKNYTLAKKACQEGLEISRNVGYQKSEKANCRCLSNAYEGLGDTKNALKYYKEFVSIKDSLVNEERDREATRKDLEFGFSKQQFQDSLQNAKEQQIKDIQISEQKAQLENEKLQKYALFGGVLLFIVLGAVSYRSYRIKKKDNKLIAAQKKEVEEQKSEIESQKAVLETKNKEITDSITYAKRIQEAILPPTKLVKEWLPNSFILYKPKDIVAGDFYWMESEGDNIFFAAADCTGHGVPGAMVSVVCHNAMNRAIKEFGITEPGEILDKTRELVVEQFEKSEEDVKDGMDVALCALNTKTNKLKYAGANNPLWLFAKGTNEITEYKATKQPIGKVDNPTHFETHVVDLEEGTSIYIFSDGFADQFGGEKGKKFKYRPFKELLSTIHEKPLEEQRMLIDDAFENWKGDLEQVDDVCIIGVKV